MPPQPIPSHILVLVQTPPSALTAPVPAEVLTLPWASEPSASREALPGMLHGQAKAPRSSPPPLHRLSAGPDGGGAFSSTARRPLKSAARPSTGNGALQADGAEMSGEGWRQDGGRLWDDRDVDVCAVVVTSSISASFPFGFSGSSSIDRRAAPAEHPSGPVRAALLEEPRTPPSQTSCFGSIPVSAFVASAWLACTSCEWNLSHLRQPSVPRARMQNICRASWRPQ